MKGRDVPLTNQELAALILDAHPKGTVHHNKVGPKRLRAHMASSGRRFPANRRGVREAILEILGEDAFRGDGESVTRRRYPALSRARLPGGGTDWVVEATHRVLADPPLDLRERAPPDGDLREALDALTRTGATRPALDAVEAPLAAFLGRLSARAARSSEDWRRRVSRALARPGVCEALLPRLRDRLAADVADAASPRSVAEVLAEALEACSREVEADLSARRFRAAVGYADHVERLRESRLPRRVVFHVGPTNSGKTHDAMAALAAAADGVYLAPLRLLALEGYERLSGMVPRAAMLTGEEAIGGPDATHLSMTIEMASLSRPCEVAVVDEVQMLLDPDRGWAWTRAILGMRCRTLHLCGSGDAAHLVARAAEILGEDVETVRHERKGPLRLERARVSHDDVVPGDALVAFSRREVLYHRQVLLDAGLRVACVYGALSPEVRRAEAARFRDGDADVLVATDAIGMGLNLGPLRRVVLTRTDKFDGRRERPLLPSEIRQIAGRAGRHGHHSEGVVAVMGGDLNAVALALQGRPDPGRRDGLFFAKPEPASLDGAARELATTSLAAVLGAFGERTVYEGSPYKPCDLEEAMEAARWLDRLDMPVSDKFDFATCPGNRRDPVAAGWLAFLAKAHAQGRKAMADPPLEVGSGDLADDEREAQMMSTYLWLARRHPGSFPDEPGATARRVAANARIEAELGERAADRARRARPRVTAA